MPADWTYCVHITAEGLCALLDEPCVQSEPCDDFEDIRHHKHESWQTDFSVCPDCGRKQSREKKPGDTCENPDCETEVIRCPICGQQIWWNDNWG